MFISNDSGKNWETVTIRSNQESSNDGGILFSFQNIAFVPITNQGVYKKTLNSKVQFEEFLRIPWEYSTNYELFDNITSYFDHEYPLLGYPYKSEPLERANTTLNFMGIRDKTPFEYYSSHNGIDFALPYGTPILAAASGVANYHYCEGCGNTIKINHSNGYQSVYMHLQSNNLVSSSPNQFINVEKDNK